MSDHEGCDGRGPGDDIDPMHPLQSLFGMLRDRGRKFSLFKVMDEDDVRGFNDLEKARKESEFASAKYQSLLQNFHSGLRLKYNQFDKEMRIDEKTSSIEIEIDNEKK